MIKIVNCYHSCCTALPMNWFHLYDREFGFCDEHLPLYLCEHGVFQSEGCLECALQPDYMDIDAPVDFIQIGSYTPDYLDRITML